MAWRCVSIVTVLGLVGGVPEGETPRVADSGTILCFLVVLYASPFVGCEN